MNEPGFVLDASALLALINGERGAARVAAVLPVARIGAVNLAEVAARMIDRGGPLAGTRENLARLELDVVAFDATLAYDAAGLRSSTRSLGLSLGDRACLALAARLNAIAITADRAWSGLPDAPCPIEVIR